MAFNLPQILFGIDFRFARDIFAISALFLLWSVPDMFLFMSMHNLTHNTGASVIWIIQSGRVSYLELCQVLGSNLDSFIDLCYLGAITNGNGRLSTSLSADHLRDCRRPIGGGQAGLCSNLSIVVSREDKMVVWSPNSPD